MTLKEAILQRASVRKFKQLPIKSEELNNFMRGLKSCLLYTSPSPRDVEESRMPSSA